MKLTPIQLKFLAAHDIPLRKVFDATGWKKTEYRQFMSALGLLVAYGVTPCRQFGHTLRTRAGHCIQCDTAKIAYMKRNDADGQVYVAWSQELALSKIGCANDSDARVGSLNNIGYAGASDWKLQYSVNCAFAGRVEMSAHDTLTKSRQTCVYLRGGLEVRSNEIFRCKPEVAIKAVRSAARGPRRTSG